MQYETKTAFLMFQKSRLFVRVSLKNSNSTDNSRIRHILPPETFLSEPALPERVL